MRLKLIDEEMLSNIYLESVLIEMDVAGVVGGSPNIGTIDSTVGNYAKDNGTVIPKILGGIQTRRGKLKKKRKSKKSRKLA